MDNCLPRELLLQNEKRFGAFFLLYQIDRVRVDFDGSGDSGSIESVGLFRKAGENYEEVELDADIKVYQTGKAVFDQEKQSWVSDPPTEEQVTIKEAIEAHVYEALERTGVNWYDSDGGFGHWEWNASTGVLFEVHSRYTESTCEHAEERPLGADEDPILDPNERGI